MCNCDCELSKHERWERIKREHAHALAEEIRSLCTCGLPDACVCEMPVGSIANIIDPEVTQLPCTHQGPECQWSRCWEKEGRDAPEEEAQGGR